MASRLIVPPRPIACTRPTCMGCGTSCSPQKKKGTFIISDECPACRGDWIGTSDLLNPIYGVEALPAAESYKCKPSGDLGNPHLPCSVNPSPYGFFPRTAATTSRMDFTI